MLLTQVQFAASPHSGSHTVCELIAGWDGLAVTSSELRSESLALRQSFFVCIITIMRMQVLIIT